MRDADDLSDVDSLASTAPSETQSEYEVEEVLAERMGSDGEKEYLLKWDGYPLERASWEPPECFLSMQEVLKAYQDKCRRIQAGNEPPFDVDAWQRGIDAHERETERRKKARRVKRLARAAQKKAKRKGKPLPRPSTSESRESSPDVPLCQTSRHSSPDVPLMKSGTATRTSRPRSGSNMSALFVPTECSELVEPQGVGFDDFMSNHSSEQMSISEGSHSPEPVSVTAPPENPTTTLGPTSSVAPLPMPTDPPMLKSTDHPPGSTVAMKPSQPTHQPLDAEKDVQDTVVQDLADANAMPNGAGSTAAAKTVRKVSQPGKAGPTPTTTSVVQEPTASPLNTALSSKKSGPRQPDISQLNLKKPSEFSPRKAAGVPIPFATMTASDASRRNSQGLAKVPSGPKALAGAKEVPTAPKALAAIAAVKNAPTAPKALAALARVMNAPTAPKALARSHTSFSSNVDPASSSVQGPRRLVSDRYRPSSPDATTEPFRGDCYRPGSEFRRSPPWQPGHRDRSPPSRPRSRSRSRSRSPLHRQRSPTTRRRSPEPRRAYDSFRPSAHSPFITVTRPKPSAFRPADPGKKPPESAPEVATPASASTPAQIQQPEMSVKDQIMRMPRGIRKPGARLFQSPYFANPGEVLAHIFFGPERHRIGAVRLCGLTFEEKKELLAAKDAHGRIAKVEMWFRDTYTRDQYDKLCKVESDAGGVNRVIRTCWMEGFEDSNPEIFHMSECLFHENIVGTYYPPGLNGYAWVAYSPKSSDFKHLALGYPDIDPGVPIHLAVRTPLPPLEALKDIATKEASRLSETTLVRRDVDAQLNQITESLRSSPAVNLSVQSSLESSEPGSPLDVRLSGQKEVEVPSAPLLGSTVAPTRSVNVSADPRVKRLPPTSLRTQNLRTGLPQAQSAGAGPMPASGDAPLVDTLASPAGSKSAILPPSSAPQSILDMYFEQNLKIQLKDLSRVSERHDGSRADMFYLHMPENEADRPDHLLLKGWLEMNGAMVWSDWAKFVKNAKYGVVLFHETFGKFHTLRPHIRTVQSTPTIAFWIYRTSRPLDHPDTRHCQPGAFFQRIFIRGGVYLLTEDIMDDLKQAIVLFRTFQNFQRKDPGIWKVACWPNLPERLAQIAADPSLSQNELKLLDILEYFINSINSIGQQPFTADSLDARNLDSPTSNVLSLSVAGYGDSKRPPSLGSLPDLTPAQHKADHLAEYFAGWTLENLVHFRKAYIITNCKSEALIKRWSSWGHVNVSSMEAFLDKYKIHNVDSEVERIVDRMSKSGRLTKSVPLNTASDRTPADLSSPSQTPQTPHTAGLPTPREPRADASNGTMPDGWRPPALQNATGFAGPYR
ncbi:Uncharacterized protein PECH_000195 [Penicillium ucsense]|uniref:Chromo domain-containing protein n=1 Tax=Penicillium ucsense TaxID=2839758 RepID=A0A8J8WJP0_9EURO|nr:Uncharacterized protein PECM_008522 [Penicillium ucsense]KAF7738478.1 Uncharacterized protein PECH_000195 [Penicillium ucsense]